MLKRIQKIMLENRELKINSDGKILGKRLLAVESQPTNTTESKLVNEDKPEAEPKLEEKNKPEAEPVSESEDPKSESESSCEEPEIKKVKLNDKTSSDDGFQNLCELTT
jgi:hypothetical protein